MGRVNPRPLLPYVLTAAALIALVGSTVLLARAYHAERRHLATTHFARGIALKQQGHGSAAIPHLRMALSLERHTDGYTLALAETLIDLGRAAEAETYLTEVLRRDPTSGIANLQRAHISQALGRAEEAELFYQRAIYGSWPQDRSPTISARFELADLLLAGDVASRRRARAVVAELRATAPEDPVTRRHLARLLLATDEPDEAAAELREVLDRDADDREAWALLSSAELALENYAATRAAARRALALGPVDREVAARLAFAERVLELDPTGPRLSARERNRRARQLLQQAMAQLDGCTGDLALLPDAAREDHQRAQTFLQRPAGLTATNELVETAERIWRARGQICPAVAADPALAAVFRRFEAEDP